MAYEQKTTRDIPLGERIGNAISSVGAGVEKAADWTLRLQQAQQQQKLMEQEMQQRQAQMQQAQAQMFDTASKQQSSIMETALSAGDPEAAMNANKEAWDRWSQYGNIKTPFDDAVAQVKSGAKLVQPYQKQINEALATLGDPNVQFDKKREAYGVASTALSTAKGLARNSIFINHFGTQKTVLDSAYQQASKEQNLTNRAMIAASAKKEAAAGKPASGVKLSSADIKPLNDMNELIAKSDRIAELAGKPENSSMFGLAGATAQADVPVVGALKRSTFSAGQLELYQNVKQLKTDYEKAQGGVREVANVNMQKAIAQNIPKGNLTKAQFISSMQSFNSMNKMMKAQKASALVKSKAGKDTSIQQEVLDKLELEPDVQGMTIKLLQGKKLGLEDLQSSGKQLSIEDQQALDWANANAKDPRAAQIKQRLGQ